MKRVVLSFLFVFAAMVVAAVRPEMVSLTSVMAVALVALALVIISLIFNPVTEYITVEKWRTYELKPPNSFRYGINFFRGQHAEFLLENGDAITGTLVGRSDGAGTFTFEVGEGIYETIPQAFLEKIRTIGVDNTPDSLLDWDDDSPLILPRSC